MVLMERRSLHVRIPVDLHEALAAEAERLGISLNSMIVIALRGWQEGRKS